MIIVLLAHAIVGALLFPTGSWLGRRSFLIAAVAPLGTVVWMLAQGGRLLNDGVIVQDVEWVPEIGLAFNLRLDAFAGLMVMLIAGIGVCVLGYSFVYFRDGTQGLARNAGLLTMFAGAMLLLVLADNTLLLYTGWELTSVASYLLIGNDHTKAHARAAALHALLVTTFGGLAMLAGFIVIGQAAGTYRLSALIGDPPGGSSVSVGLFLVLLGAFTKSAQYPFHAWLPGAMAAPTPVSAYLHSATMVKGGVYLIARLAPAFAAVAMWRPIVLVVGAVTMILGALRALRQVDLKLLLAFGTVSQLGFLVVVFGLGTADATAAGCVILVAHATFKAALFMAVGTVDRLTGTRDINKIPRLSRAWRPFMAVTVVCASSMAGVPLLFGFIGKDAAFAAFARSDIRGGGWILAAIVTGAALTVAYTLRFVVGMFRGTIPAEAVPPVKVGFVAPIAVLATITVVYGVIPGIADRFVSAAARTLDAGAEVVHLQLWHGITLALLLSVVVLVGGLVLFVLRVHVESVLNRVPHVASGTEVYTWLLRRTNEFATRVTGVVQHGSLPIYAGVTLLTAAVVPGVVLLSGLAWPGWPPVVQGIAQVPVVVALLGAAIAAALVRRRFSAALFLGTTGYAMAGLFVVQGAPDLALTQVAIETLSTVLFVLVLRRLPDRFERTSSNTRRIVRLAISAVVGVVVFGFAIASSQHRTNEPVSGEMIDRSLPDGHGRNVVNVILVDFRGLDTMGEITVLASAAIGAVALARADTRRSRRSRRQSRDISPDEALA